MFYNKYSAKKTFTHWRNKWEKNIVFKRSKWRLVISILNFCSKKKTAAVYHSRVITVISVWPCNIQRREHLIKCINGNFESIFFFLIKYTLCWLHSRYTHRVGHTKKKRRESLLKLSYILLASSMIKLIFPLERNENEWNRLIFHFGTRKSLNLCKKMSPLFKEL